MTDEPIDTTADELPDTQALAVRPDATLAVTPDIQASELVARLAVIKEAMDSAMTPGVDYGMVPGVSKPTLLKPGAEKLGVLFQLDVQPVNEQTWHPDGHLTVTSRATVYHAPTQIRMGYGEGLCTSREKKYAKRKASRACPECGVEAIIKGKAEYGGGWVCFHKKGGCKAKFGDNDERITSQQVGEVDNPDLADTYNTVTKMAAKRARVDAILAVTGASALFTQDAEDLAGATPEAVAVELPAWAAPVSPDLANTTRAAVEYLLSSDLPVANDVMAKLTVDTDGELVAAVGRAIVMTISAYKKKQDAAGASTPEPVQAELGAQPA